MANLYELTAEFEQLLMEVEADAVNSDTEESAVLFEKLSQAGIELDGKIDNIIGYIKNLTADADALKNEEAVLKNRRQAKERKIDSLKRYLLSAGVERYESITGVITTRISKAIEIENADDVPEMYCTRKETFTPDKTLIKKAILGGEEVAGAVLVERKNLGVK